MFEGLVFGFGDVVPCVSSIVKAEVFFLVRSVPDVFVVFRHFVVVFELRWEIVAVKVCCRDFAGGGDDVDGVKSSDGAIDSDDGWVGGVEE